MFEFLWSRVEGVRESLSEAMGSDQEEENETHEIKTDASLEKLRQRNVEGYHDVPDQVGSYEIKVNVPILIRWGNRDSYREVECCLENNRWSIKVDGTAGKKVALARDLNKGEAVEKAVEYMRKTSDVDTDDAEAGVIDEEAMMQQVDDVLDEVGNIDEFRNMMEESGSEESGEGSEIESDETETDSEDVEEKNIEE